LHNDGVRNTLQELETGLTGIGSTPSFAIGQRAILVQTEQGNVLWDCISLLDNETIQAVEQLGGIDAIAISHPHFYTSMVDWANAFDAQIYLHEADNRWIMRPDERITLWSGEAQPLLEDITLIRLGGHFAGSTVLHWASGSGFLLTGDTIQVVADRNWVSFMYSYPNTIPLPASKVASMRDIIAQYDFERLYGGWFPSVVAQDAKNAVMRSADRYIRALDGAFV
jgi:glyoxylase-like metal-dependent hydrolase (beta-lactamase superfamily II)